MARVFISCLRADLQDARELQSALAPRHTAHWIDREAHGSEEDWRKAAEGAIAAADAVLFIISPESIQSRPCRLELGEAWRSSAGSSPSCGERWI